MPMQLFKRKEFQGQGGKEAQETGLKALDAVAGKSREPGRKVFPE